MCDCELWLIIQISEVIWGVADYKLQWKRTDRHGGQELLRHS